MLEFRRLTKSYTPDRRAVDDVSLTIEAGEVFCLLGPSGCGKTTLLRLAAGLERPDSGAVVLDGRDITRDPVHERHFGFMFQDYALFPHKSVAENIAFGLRMEGRARPEIERRVAEMLELVGLPDYGARTVFELSGGERQRVALARSLAPEPRLLMLDEPLANLDRALRESLMLDLRAILKQIDVTAIYVTHDQQEAFAISDRLAVMRAGRIVQVGAPERVHDHPNSPFVAAFLGLSNQIPATIGSDIVTPLGKLPASLIQDGASDEAVLLIRPDAAYNVVKTDEKPSQSLSATSTSAQNSEKRVSLHGTLTRVTFRGSHCRIEISVAMAEKEHAFVFNLPAYPVDPRTGRPTPLDQPEVGCAVRVDLYTELLLLLPSARFYLDSQADQSDSA